MSTAARPRRTRLAFTLMEVLLVLVILVILAGMATFAIRRAQIQANESAARAQIGAFKQALDGYQINLQSYPTTEQGLNALMAPPADLRNPAKWKGPYLNQPELPLDPWGNAYEYVLVGTEQVQIRSLGLDGTPDTEDDIVM